MTLTIGTRGSALALAQTGAFARTLEAASGCRTELRIIKTRGDQVQDRPLAAIGGKGLFTLELEEALRSGGIDLAVHSLKDLPTDDPEGLMLGCVPEREAPWDVLVGPALHELAAGAVVGTGSLRRRVQLLAVRPDLTIRDIRGNVDTRLRKLREEPYDAIVLARAGLNRVGVDLSGTDHRDLPAEICLPAPGQGALGIQCRSGDPATRLLLATVEHFETRTCIRAERAFLATVEGGCNVPAGALASLDHRDQLTVEAMLADDDGRIVRQVRAGRPAEAEAMGTDLARALRAALAAG